MIRVPFLLLIIFSAFNMNLTLQCALGLGGIPTSKNFDKRLALIKLSVVFTSVILLWVFFSRIIVSVFSGVFIYVLLFPVSYIVCDGLDFLLFRYILEEDREEECVISFPEGITAVAVFICINIANNFLETAVLSFGFTAGILLVSFILWEIRERASLEAVPRFLRGKPLVLISMGFLSLVFSAGSLLLLRMISAR